MDRGGSRAPPFHVTVRLWAVTNRTPGNDPADADANHAILDGRARLNGGSGISGLDLASLVNVTYAAVMETFTEQRDMDKWLRELNAKPRPPRGVHPTDRAALPVLAAMPQLGGK